MDTKEAEQTIEDITEKPVKNRITGINEEVREAEQGTRRNLEVIITEGDMLLGIKTMLSEKRRENSSKQGIIVHFKRIALLSLQSLALLKTLLGC